MLLMCRIQWLRLQSLWVLPAWLSLCGGSGRWVRLLAMDIPKFTTQRLLLKGVTAADIPAYTQHFVDYEVIRNLAATVPWPYPADGVQDFVLNDILPAQGKDRWVWGLFLRDVPTELIGAVDLWREGKPEHRGFWLGKEFWGQGYMTEAVAPITDYAFAELGFDELIFENAVANLRSRRVKEKMGAEFLRTRTASYVDPSFSESELWRLSKQAWQEFRSS